MKPRGGAFEVQSVEMDDQVDGSASSLGAIPVHEFDVVDGDRTLNGVPLFFVVWVLLSSSGE